MPNQSYTVVVIADTGHDSTCTQDVAMNVASDVLPPRATHAQSSVLPPACHEILPAHARPALRKIDQLGLHD